MGVISVGFIFGIGISILLYLFMTEADFLFSSSGVESLMGLASAFLGAGITIVGIYWTLKHESNSNRRRDMKQVISDKTEERIMHMPKITVFFEVLDKFPEAIEKSGKFRVYILDSFDLDAKPIMSKFRMVVRNYGFGYAADFMTSFAFESRPSVSLQDADFLFVDSDQSAESYIEVQYLPLALGEELEVDFSMTYKDVFEYSYSYVKGFKLVGTSYVEDGVHVERTSFHDFPGMSGHQIYEPIENYNEITIGGIENAAIIKSYRNKIYYGNFELLDYPSTIKRSVEPVLRDFYNKFKVDEFASSDMDFDYYGSWKGDPLYRFSQEVDFGSGSKLRIKIVCTYDYLDSRIIDIECEIDQSEYVGHISRLEMWRIIYSLKRAIEKGVSFL